MNACSIVAALREVGPPLVVDSHDPGLRNAWAVLDGVVRAHGQMNGARVLAGTGEEDDEAWPVAPRNLRHALVRRTVRR